MNTASQNILPPDLKSEIEGCINSSDLVLFMKGDRSFPQCGFSARVVEALEDLQVDFKTYDVLSSEELRSGLKIYSNWPTFPQLYLKGELLGGHDIVMSLLQSGELQKKFREAKLLA